jgi:hypothetical protein
MARLLRLVAVLASAIVALGFVLFAVDEANKGSQTQQQKLRNALEHAPAPGAAAERDRERSHGQLREYIDDANDLLLSPFTGVVTSRNLWVQHVIPALLALLAYGVGLSLLANFLPKPRAHGGDWRVAA